MTSKKLKSPVSPDRYYHIYNRGNNREKLFYQTEDFRFFMDKFKVYVAPFADIYAFCLIPNHFHFLLKTRNEIANSRSVIPNQLRKLFISHTKRINYLYNRTGGLFTKNYQRIEIKEESYLVHLVNYIHKNPVKHGIQFDFTQYEYSSYKIIAGTNRTIIRRDEVLDWFGGLEEFMLNHQTAPFDPDFLKKYNLKDDE